MSAPQGSPSGADSPVRTCVGCRARAPQADLVRTVAVGDAVVVDRHAPGRGAWIHPDPACVAAADRRRAWGRALRHPGPLDTSAVHGTVAGPSGPGGQV